MNANNYKYQKSLPVFPDRDSIVAVSDFLDLCLEDCGIEMKQGFRLKVIADELYSNIVFYSGAKKACVSFAFDGEYIFLDFSDDGAAFDPFNAQLPDLEAELEDREPGGLGIFMVRSMADDMRYEYADGENRLYVRLKAADDKGEKAGTAIK